MNVLRLPTQLTTLASQANDNHTKAVASAGQALLYAMGAGDALNEAKRQLLGDLPRASPGSPRWLDWVAENFVASPTMATKYMRLANHRAFIEGKIAGRNGVPTCPGELPSIREALAMLPSERKVRAPRDERPSESEAAPSEPRRGKRRAVDDDDEKPLKLSKNAKVGETIICEAEALARLFSSSLTRRALHGVRDRPATIKALRDLVRETQAIIKAIEAIK